MVKRWWLFLALWGMMLAGCTWWQAAPAVTPTLPPTATSLPTATPPPTATPAPTATAPPASTITPTPAPTHAGAPQACVPPSDAATLPQPVSFAAMMQGGLLEALNAGMTAEALNTALQRAQIGAYPFAAASGDFDGDGMADVAVSLFDPASTSHPPQGVLLVFLCREGAFVPPAVFQEPATDRAWGVPTIQDAQDLNADGRAELLVSAAHCDETGLVCAERYAILGWREGGLRDLLRDADQPFASAVPFVEDPDGDGIYDFVVITGEGQRLTWRYADGFWQRTP